jgi:hypothetical protein
MAADEPQDGYPASPEEDTKPDSPPLGLDEADELREHEHVFTPEGTGPDGTTAQEDTFNDDEELDAVEGTGLIQSTPVVPVADAEASE